MLQVRPAIRRALRSSVVQDAINNAGSIATDHGIRCHAVILPYNALWCRTQAEAGFPRATSLSLNACRNEASSAISSRAR